MKNAMSSIVEGLEYVDVNKYYVTTAGVVKKRSIKNIKHRKRINTFRRTINGLTNLLIHTVALAIIALTMTALVVIPACIEAFM